MTLKEGDQLPDATFVVMENGAPAAKTTDELFSGRNVALFGLPGAYTPICHKEHLPGIVQLRDVLMKNGIDSVACTAVNDVFVLQRWAHELQAEEKITMLADGNADFAVKSGLEIDMSRYGLGIRSNRYAMLISDKHVKLLSVEDAIMDHKVSSAANLVDKVDGSGGFKATG